MNNFSISQLAQYSGLKPHTIRIWEQRYNALQPSRSEGNTRYYDDNQLRRLLNIVTLSATGHKISDLCIMKDTQLFKLIQEHNIETESFQHGYYINRLVAAAMTFDEISFEKIFAHCLLRFSMQEVYIKIVYVLMQRMGMLWAADVIPPAKEHFVSNLLRQKFFTAIDALAAPKYHDQVWICFLPENEFHEVGLLFATYLIRLSGRRVIYLGSNLPWNSLSGAVKETKATHLLTFFVKKNTNEYYEEVFNLLKSSYPQKKVYIAGDPSSINSIKLPGNISWLSSPDELEQVLKNKSV